MCCFNGLWAAYLNQSPEECDLEVPRGELLQCAARGYTDIGRTSAAAQLHYQGFRSRGNRSCVITQGGTTSRATNSTIPNVISTRRLGHLGWGASVRLLYSTMATRPRHLVSRLVRLVKIVKANGKANGYNWDAGCNWIQETLASGLGLLESRRCAVLASGIPGQSMLPHCSDGARQELCTMDGWMRC